MASWWPEAEGSHRLRADTLCRYAQLPDGWMPDSRPVLTV